MSRYYSPVFFQGDDYDELSDILEEHGPEAAIDHAAQWDTPDAAEAAEIMGDIVDRDQIGPHWHERTYEEGRYILIESTRWGYAALYAREEQS